MLPRRPYPEEIEQKIQIYYQSLSEKERRRYAAIEAEKLGYGGISYLVKLLGCHPGTIRRGKEELSSPEAMSQSRIRKKGAGRKKRLETIKGLDEAFLRVIDKHIAGSPMDESIRWTHLTRQQIADLINSEEKIKVSVTVIDQIRSKHGFRRRQAEKTKATGSNPLRNQQFEKIKHLIADYQRLGNPVMSVDTKKKEKLGQFYRKGTTRNQKPIKVYDHDWPSLASGIVIPHALYDLTHNKGYVNIGTSHDTSELACDSIRHWWINYGSKLYPVATSILLLCDGGGSNSSRSYLFKEAILAHPQDLGIEIRIAHYPPYTSKYNPIEHRLFPHLTRACSGVIFDSHETVNSLMSKATTRSGLKVFSNIIDRLYQTGKKVAQDFKETMNVIFDEHLPQWNYVVKPESV